MSKTRATLSELLTIAAIAAAVFALAACSKGPGPQANPAAPPGSAAGAPGGGLQGSQPGRAPGAAPGAAGTGRRAAATAVQATVVSVGTLFADRDTAGVITPATQSQVAAAVGGIVAGVLRQSGDWVGAGDTVVQLDDSLLRLAVANSQAALDTATINLRAVQDSADQSSVKLGFQVESAQSSYDSAKKFYDSQKALFDLGGISASALDTAKSQLATAQAGLETARMALDQNQRGIATTPGQNIDALKVAIQTATNNLELARYNLRNAAVRAPFAGQIASLSVTPGMFVGQNGSAFTLVSAERQVNFNIAPSDAPAVQSGKALSFELGGKSYALKVKQAPSIPVNGVVSLIASIAGASAIPFGSVGNVSYLVPLAIGAFVPINALDTVENRNLVYSIVNGRVAARSVVVLATSGSVAAVSGIEAGTTVIISPPPGLLEGAQVQPTIVALPGLAAGGQAAAPAKGNSPGTGAREQGQAGQAGQRGPRAGGTATAPSAPAAKP